MNILQSLYASEIDCSLSAHAAGISWTIASPFDATKKRKGRALTLAVAASDMRRAAIEMFPESSFAASKRPRKRASVSSQIAARKAGKVTVVRRAAR